ncbi:MAG: hypothetical protein KDM63_08860, partial [Verrucomicrobiae bacterium]|nr:hypothetical protein [Verrucomicrobiae bacterium]
MKSPRFLVSAALGTIVVGAGFLWSFSSSSAQEVQAKSSTSWQWYEQTLGYFGADLDAATVVKVTSLAPDGAGSLREAIESNAEGPRLIVFEVGGVID